MTVKYGRDRDRPHPSEVVKARRRSSKFCPQCDYARMTQPNKQLGGERTTDIPDRNDRVSKIIRAIAHLESLHSSISRDARPPDRLDSY